MQAIPSNNFIQNSRDKFLKVEVQEQMVPSGGFSPQQQMQETNYLNDFVTPIFRTNQYSANDSTIPYENVAESFDLSLLEDPYQDAMASLDWAWNQPSLYASSPFSDGRAYSPECTKPYIADQSLPVASNNQQTLSIGDNMICNNVEDNNGNSALRNSLSPSNDVDSCDRNIMIRQCLEDTEYKARYNYTPVDIPFMTTTTDVDAMLMLKSKGSADFPAVELSGNESMEINPNDPGIGQVYEKLQSNIQNMCNILSISPDPTQWSVTDVQSWLVYSLSSLLGVQYDGINTNNPRICAALQNFKHIDGRTLCSFTEEEFRGRDTETGDMLYANMNLCKVFHGKGDGALKSHFNSLIPQNDFDSSSNSMGSFNQFSMSSPSPGSTMSQDKFEDFNMHDTFTSPRFSNPSSVDTSSRNSDDDSDDEDEKPTGKTKTARTSGSKSGAHIHLWQFLKELLDQSQQQNSSCIRWTEKNEGIFRIEDSVRVAKLWGLRKNRPAMNYDKLSRSIRQYYKKGIMKKTARSQRLVYQFCHPYGF